MCVCAPGTLRLQAGCFQVRASEPVCSVQCGVQCGATLVVADCELRSELHSHLELVHNLKAQRVVVSFCGGIGRG